MKNKIDNRLDVLEQKIDFNNIETALITLLIGGIAILITIYQPIIESRNIFYLSFLVISLITLPISLIFEIYSFFDEKNSTKFKFISILSSTYLILSVLLFFVFDIIVVIFSKIGWNSYVDSVNIILSIVYVFLFIIIVRPHLGKHLKKRFPLIFLK